MIVSLNQNVVGVLFLVFLAGGIIWFLLNMASSGVDAIQLSKAESEDEARTHQQKSKNHNKFATLTKKTYSEFQGNSDFVFPDDDRLDKFLLATLIWFKVGIFDKRQIVGKKYSEIENYVVNRVNAYLG